MNSTTKAHLSLFIAQVIYSISFVVGKILTASYMPALALVLVRMMVAMPLFWITSLLFVREKTNKKDIPRFILLAFFGVAINQTFFIKGLSLTSPISAAIMMITTPILVLIIAALLLKERITLLKTLGIVLGFAGAAVLMLNSGLNTSGRSDNPMGDLMIFINATAWGTYLVMVKPMMKKYQTVTILKWIFVFGLILVFPFGYSDLRATAWSSFGTTIWLYIAFMAIGTTFIAYILNVYALNALSPSVVSAYIYLQPLMTAVLAISTGHDSINWMKVFAATLIFAGVYLASMNTKRKESFVEPL